MPVFETACPLDCPDSCSLEVTVRDGRVVSLEGSRRNPFTQGFICGKVRRFPQHLYGAQRIPAPGLRAGGKGDGKFRFVSWDEALDRIVREIEAARDRFGAESILPFYYGGSNGLLSQSSTDRRFFNRLGASRLARTVCAAPTTAAATGLYGKMAGVSPTDYPHAKLIVVWGANPSASGIHFVPPIQEARRRGAKLVVVDPRRINLAKCADLHIAPRPGTDLPIALALIRWLFDNRRADLEFLKTHATGIDALRHRASLWGLREAADAAGVEASDLETFARLYADSSPAVIRCGWGLERNRNGGSAVAAVLALPAVAGKFGVRGGGYTMSNSGAWKRLTNDQAAQAPEPDTRIVNMNHLGRVLQDAHPPLKVLFVYNCNPLATMPEQQKVRAGLRREDLFTVVFDQVLTDTARFADVVLPATTFLEHRDLARGYGAMVLHETLPVIDPVGGARSNLEVFAELCRRMGLERPGDVTDADAFASQVLRDADPADNVVGQLAERRIAYPAAGFEPVQFSDVFPKTDDGKIHLFPEHLDREAPMGLYRHQPDPATEDYPLALISPATGQTVSSTLGQLNRRQAVLQIHPADARPRRIRDGDQVRVHNASGEVRCHASLTRDVRPGTLVLPKGLWSHNTLDGNTANALAPDTLTDLGAGACFNDARVDVEVATKSLRLESPAMGRALPEVTAAGAKAQAPRPSETGPVRDAD